MKAGRGAFSSLLLVGALAALGGTAGAQEHATATFAGGCFCCMQPPFEKLAGVVPTTVSYTGRQANNPTYEAVSAGRPHPPAATAHGHLPGTNASAAP